MDWNHIGQILKDAQLSLGDLEDSILGNPDFGWADCGCGCEDLVACYSPAQLEVLAAISMFRKHDLPTYMWE